MSKVTIKFWDTEANKYWDSWQVEKLGWIIDARGEVQEICAGCGFRFVEGVELHYYKDGERIA